MKISLNFFKMFPIYTFISLLVLTAIPFYLPFLGGSFYLLIIFIFLTYYIVQKKKSIRIDYLSISMLLLLIYFAVSISWSINKPKGIILLFSWIIFFLGYHTPFVVERRAIISFYKSYYWFGAILALIGLIAYFAGLEPDANFLPLNRNLAVYNILLVAPVILILNSRLKATLLRYRLNQLAFLIITMSILLHFSRYGYLNYIFIFFFTLVGLGHTKKLIKYAAIFSAIVLLFLLYPPILKRMSSLYIAVDVYIGLFINSSVITDRNWQRYNILLYGIEIMKDYFFFGTGLGGYLDILLRDYDTFNLKKTPHNGVLRLLGEFGIVGTIIFFHYWLSLLYITYKTGKMSLSQDDKLVCAYLFGLVGMYISAQFFGELFNNAFILLMMMPAYQYLRLIRDEVKAKSAEEEVIKNVAL